MKSLCNTVGIKKFQFLRQLINEFSFRRKITRPGCIFICFVYFKFLQYLLKEKQVCIQNLQQEEEKMCNAIPKKIQDIKNNFFP